ncbi:MAG TPA: molybdopterin-guanine dinucleotide biosynthesis protein B [Spirochaetota bacterium]|nr:molybdopterin-guanine dinucleotide biosynthesis protein B [Spirochaetota bacterium]HQO40204.1 molybdopterin-guanine dinucleotide biosynthesis protein B [Spirochaetota bacterium]
MQKIITIIGRSGSGKTTLVEKLIRHYRSQGKKVSALKSMRHEFNIDHEGKDTWRYREAGVFSAAITNGKTMAFISDIDTDYTPLDLAHLYFPDSDIIIIEGYKESRSPKIEVIGDSTEEPLFVTDNAIKILVTDRDIVSVLPVIKRNNIDGIIEAIEKIY